MKKGYYLFLLYFIFSSCTKKDVKPNITGTVSGVAYDETNQEPYPNLTVTVNEFKMTNSFFNSQTVFVKTIGSGVTDATGHYLFKYTTTGGGNIYYIGFGKLPLTIRSIGPKDSVWGFNILNPWRIQPITNVGSAITFNINPFKVYIMQSRVILSNNPYDLLYQGFQCSGHLMYGPTEVTKKNADTVINLQIIKNTGGFNIYFYIVNPADNNYHSSPLTPLNPVINKDTIPGPVFTLDASTFK